MDRLRRTLRESALLIGLLLGGLLLGSAAIAVWDATRAADELGSTATVALGLGDTTSLSSRLDGLVPGSSRDHTITVTNDSSADATLTYAVRGSGGQAVTTDATDGLRVRVWECTAAYAAGACTGTETEATAPAGVDVPDGALATAWTSTAVAPGGTRHLRIRVVLPTTAPSTMQGQMFALAHVFRATLSATPPA